jgi:small subunit ribosomal protein S16
VLTDSKNGPKSGKSLEILGSYDVRGDNKIEQIKVDRVKYWMSQGAKLSDTVHNYLVSKKVVTGKKINALPKKKPIVKEGEKTAEATAPVAPAEAPAPAPVA